MINPNLRNDLFSRLTWGLLLVGLLFLTAPSFAEDPVVDSADPPEAEQATYDLEVTVSGDNFGPDSEVDFFITGTADPGGIKVKKVHRKNPKTLKVTIDVAPDAQTENKFDIQVRSRGRTGKGTELFSVLEKPKEKDLVWQVDIPDLEDCNLYATPSTFSNSGSNEVEVFVNKEPETGQIYTVFSLTVAEPERIGFRNLGFWGCRTTSANPPDPCEGCIYQYFPGFAGTTYNNVDCYPNCSSGLPPPFVGCGLGYLPMKNFMEGSLHPADGYDHFSLRFIVHRDITDPASYDYDDETHTYSLKDDAYLWRLSLWNTDEVMETGYENFHNIVCAYWIDLEDVVVEWSGGDEWIVTVDQCGLGVSNGGVCPDSDTGNTGRYIVFWETYYEGVKKYKGNSGKYSIEPEVRYVQGSGTPFKFVTKWKRISIE